MSAFGYHDALRLDLLKLLVRHRRLCGQMKKLLIETRGQALFDRLSQLAPEATASPVLRAMKPFIGPTNPKKNKRKPIPMVRNEEGKICQTASEADLERALRRVPKAPSSGPDGLPGELRRHEPAVLARILYVGLLKTIIHGHEPLAFKGGQLTPAFKGKEPADVCSSFRSLLVSSHLGKVIHRTIRQHTSPIYERFLPQ